MSQITVETTVAKNIQTVWEHWTNPASIKVWSHAEDNWGVGEVANDLRVGGTFNTEMKALDGSATFNWTGTYTEVVPLQKIAYEMRDGNTVRRVSIMFEKVGEDQTKIVESFDPENTHTEELQKAGWQLILDNFKKFVEAH